MEKERGWWANRVGAIIACAFHRVGADIRRKVLLRFTAEDCLQRLRGGDPNHDRVFVELLPRKQAGPLLRHLIRPRWQGGAHRQWGGLNSVY